MIVIITFFSVISGLIIGSLISNAELVNNTINYIVPIILMSIMVSIGIDLSNNATILFENLKKNGIKIIVIPFGILLGSILSGIIAGYFMNINLNISTSISAGMGYYSITTILLKELSGNSIIGLLAFMTNLFREILAFILIPFIAKKIGYLETIAISGVNSLDTTLPLISINTNNHIVIISVLNGMILSILVPFLIPLLYKYLI